MRYLLLMLSVLLYANINVYVDKKFDYDLPDGFERIEYGSLKDFNKTNGVVIVDYNDLPYLIENNFTILTGIGEVETYIMSHKHINNIKTVANANLPAKIFLSAFEDVKFVNKTIEDFISDKVDCIVTNDKLDIEGVFYYDMDELDVEFNRFYVGVKDDVYKNNPNEMLKLFDSFPNVKLNSSLLLTAHYLHRRVKLSDLYSNLFRELGSDKLKVVLTPYWPPFNFNDKGELKGISVDFWRLIAQKADLNYELITEASWTNVVNGIKNGKYDLVPNTSKTPDREKYAIFSKPFAEFPLAIACRDDLDIESIDDIKSIAVGKNYTAHKMMKEHYPNLNYIPVNNVIQAIKLVKNKKADCFVDIFPTVVWMINQQGIGFIKIYFKTDFTFKMMVMLRKDLTDVRDEINKAIDKISTLEKNQIMSKYIDEDVLVKDDGKMDWQYVLIIMVMVLLLVMIVFKTLTYKKKSELDALTGVYNRGAIEAIMRKMIKETDGSVILLDIDHFKKINDTYGHEKGDLVLAALAKILKRSIRKSDYFGRWGGEEFVIILPHASYDVAYKIAQKLREIVEQVDFDGIHITISLGVTEYKQGENIKEVFKRADEALYDAKNSGRNQVKGKK
ncbi:MAG: diguanylate cyclase [Epsilonproteobacteria bacterium]|nr:diguanylate cyclase [Campylobacterota bacterium]